MKLVKIASSIVASIIIVLAIGGYVFIRNFDLNRYKPYIENIVLNATGRTLTMNGEASLAISLVPTIVINDVSLSNPDWAKNPNMVELDKLEVKFAVMPLLKNRIVIDKLILHGTKVYLEKAQDGKANWVFDTKVQNVTKAQIASELANVKVDNATEAAVGMVLIARNVDITDGVLNYYDAKANNNHLLEIENISAMLNGFDKPLVVDANVKYNGEKIGVDATLNTVNSVINEDKLNFEAKVEAFNIKADVVGGVDGVLANPVYALEGNIYNPKGNFLLPEIELATRIDGDIASAKAIIQKLMLAGNEITGEADVNWGGAKQMIKVDLVAPKFDINSIVSDKKQSFVMPPLINEANALTFVPNDVVDFSFLNMANADASLKVENLILPQNAILKNVDLKAKLQNGLLDVSPFSFEIGDGKIIGDVSVAASNNMIKAEIKTQNMKLQDVETMLFDADSALKINQGGGLSLDLSLSTSGNTYRKLSENLNGRLVTILDKTSIGGANLSWLTKNIIGQILSLLKVDVAKATNLDINCAVIRSDFEGGKAMFPSGIAFNSEQIKMVGSGEVNLVSDAIDFTIAPTLNKLADGNITQALASFIKIEGTLNSPKLRLDASSALNTIVGAMVTGGISLGGEVLLSGDDDPCRSALINTAYANKFKQTTGVKSSTKRAYQEVNKQAKNAMKGIGNAAKNLLGAFKNQF